jgi:hypothetical protein
VVQKSETHKELESELELEVESKIWPEHRFIEIFLLVKSDIH